MQKEDCVSEVKALVTVLKGKVNTSDILEINVILTYHLEYTFSLS